MLPRSLRSLTLVFLLAFLIVTFGTGYAIYSTTLSTIRGIVDRRIEAVNDSVSGTPSNRSVAKIVARIDRSAGERDTGDIGFMLMDGRGVGWAATSPRPAACRPVSRRCIRMIASLVCRRGVRWCAISVTA